MLKQNIEEIKGTLERYPFPLEVIVEVSSYCNLNCVMCPQPKLTRPRGHMSNHTFEKIVDEMVKESPKSRIWPAIMGEPLLDPGIIKKLSYAGDAGIDIQLNTNAILVPAETAKKLVDCKVNTFYIGLDAMYKKTYDKIRLDGDFFLAVKHTIGLIEIAKESNSKVVVQLINMEENDAEVQNFIDFWTGLGAIVKIRPRLGWGQGVETSSLVLSESERDFPCPWITRTISIHWNGSIVQCDADWDDKDVLGNVNTITIKDIWDGELAKNRERHWNKDYNFGNCDKCKDWQAGKSYFYYPEE